MTSTSQWSLGRLRLGMIVSPDSRVSVLGRGWHGREDATVLEAHRHGPPLRGRLDSRCDPDGAGRRARSVAGRLFERRCRRVRVGPSQRPAARRQRLVVPPDGAASLPRRAGAGDAREHGRQLVHAVVAAQQRRLLRVRAQLRPGSGARGRLPRRTAAGRDGPHRGVSRRTGGVCRTGPRRDGCREGGPRRAQPGRDVASLLPQVPRAAPRGWTR